MKKNNKALLIILIIIVSIAIIALTFYILLSNKGKINQCFNNIFSYSRRKTREQRTKYDIRSFT